MTFIDYFPNMHMHHWHLNNSYVQQSMHQVHVSLELIYETIKAKKSKMGIIGNGMDIRSAMGKLFSSAGRNNC